MVEDAKRSLSGVPPEHRHHLERLGGAAADAVLAHRYTRVQIRSTETGIRIETQTTGGNHADRGVRRRRRRRRADTLGHQRLLERQQHAAGRQPGGNAKPAERSRLDRHRIRQRRRCAGSASQRRARGRRARQAGVDRRPAEGPRRRARPRRKRRLGHTWTRPGRHIRAVSKTRQTDTRNRNAAHSRRPERDDDAQDRR